jgi:hypothetical protein
LSRRQKRRHIVYLSKNARAVLKTLVITAFVTSISLGQEAPKRVFLTAGDLPSGAVGLSTTDVIKAVNQKCVNVTITNDKAKADYVLETAYAWCCTPRGESRGYKFALFNKDGDAIFSTKTHTLTNAVRDVCNAINAGKTAR